MKQQKVKWMDYILLHSAILLYSCTSIFSKIAAEYEFFSPKFIFFYGLMMFLTVVYSGLWQIILGRIPLITATTNKAVGTVWMALWGVLFFNEALDFKKILGLILVTVGALIVVRDNE